MQDIQAKVRHLPQSAQKVRAVIDLVRGKGANEALEILRFVNKRAAEPVQKLVASAVANAEENFGVSVMIYMLQKSPLMKRQPVSGDVLVHADASSRYCDAPHM
ncbi:MAG: 50S ribosomal protein L22 [Chloroflexi bacterium OLB14]|nr:MAG: 50S ribosomal protein L22 [Chloroflexi bacterium OLB14]